MNSLNVQDLSVSDIRIDEATQIRKVDKEGEGYQALRDDMRKNGLRQPIEVREARDGGFIVVAGHHRLEAAIELGWDTIPSSIQQFNTGEDVIIRQMLENANRVEQKPAEFGRGVLAILNNHPTYTIQDIASMCSRGTQYIEQRVGLARKLTPEVLEQVNERNISLSSAIQLSKLPEEDQLNFVELAATHTAEDFGTEVAVHLSNIKKRNAVIESDVDFVPTPKLRKRGEVNDEMLSAQANFNRQRVDFSEINQETAEFAAGYLEGVRYALSLDSDTVQAKRAEHEAALAEKREKQLNKQSAKMSGELFKNAPAVPSDI